MGGVSRVLGAHGKERQDQDEEVLNKREREAHKRKDPLKTQRKTKGERMVVLCMAHAKTLNAMF